MGWGRVENETPKQTSDRIIAQMRANARKATADQAKKRGR